MFSMGSSNSISGSPVAYAGGGGGGARGPGIRGGSSGGTGGGGNGADSAGNGGTAGATNRGGGGGGGGFEPAAGPAWGNQPGGSGIIILRAPSLAKFTVSPGTNTITNAPNGDQVATFTVTGKLII
jgi:hypothetical protein